MTAQPKTAGWAPSAPGRFPMTMHQPGERQTSPRLVGKNDLSDLRAFADPSQLTTLILDACPISDLGPLAELSQLTELTLWRCEQVSDLGPLAALSQLTTLHL